MLELSPTIFLTVLLYATSSTSAHLIQDWNAYNYYDDDDSFDNIIDGRSHGQVDRVNAFSNSRSGHKSTHISQVLSSERQLVRREARKKSNNAPAAPKSPAPAKPKQAPAQPKQAPAQPKQDKKQQAAERNAAANKAKADTNAKKQADKEAKQKSKDQKMVTNNLAREKKAQDAAGVKAQKQATKIKDGYNRGIDKENKEVVKEKNHVQGDLSRAQREVAKQKGKKGEAKAKERLSRAQNWEASLGKNHDGRLKSLASKTNSELGKNGQNLDRGMAKAHAGEFDANGRAKEHLNGWQKFKKVAKTIAIEGAMALGGAVLSVIPGGAVAVAGMAAARVAATAARIGAQAGKIGSKAGKIGGKAGKKGGKEGQKQGEKGGAPPIDYRVQTGEQIAASQKNNDLQKASLRTTNDGIMNKINSNLGQKITKRDPMELLWLDFDEDYDTT